MQNMEFDDLRTFVAVAETRSMSQAARQLFLTQPAVTRRLQRLETTLGSPLVDRKRRPFALTPAGHQVLERCRRVLHSVREVREAIAGEWKQGAGDELDRGGRPFDVEKDGPEPADEVPCRRLGHPAAAGPAIWLGPRQTGSKPRSTPLSV